MEQRESVGRPQGQRRVAFPKAPGPWHVYQRNPRVVSDIHLGIYGLRLDASLVHPDRLSLPGSLLDLIPTALARDTRRTLDARRSNRYCS